MKKYKITENNITYDIQEYYNGDKAWCINGKYHRENGPAIEYACGTKCWYKNGKRHRENGPAIEYDDGPAIEYANGKKDYWYNGKYLEHINSNEELKRYVKLLSIS